MKRIVVHTADWHLGKNRKYADYLEQQRLMLQALLRLIQDLITQNPDTEIWLIVAGDLFDRNEDTDRDEFVLSIVFSLFPLLELEKKYPQFKSFWIDGNHDRQPVDPTDPHALISVVSPLVKMLPEGRIAVGSPLFNAQENILLVPFGQYREEGLLTLLKTYPAEFVVMHECLYGISTDTGWKPPRDQDKYINIENVIAEAPHVTAMFVGDIHRCQKLDAEGVCWYSGSLVTLDHGHKMPKGALIHTFTKIEDRWSREGEPTLKSLKDYEPKLKTHIQLGVLDNPDTIPFDVLATYPDHYIQCVVSPEVYHLVSKQLPSLFDNKQVSWEYVTEDSKPNRVVESEEPKEENTLDYYKPLIEQWLGERGKELTQAEKEAALARILNDFGTRN